MYKAAWEQFGEKAGHHLPSLAMAHSSDKLSALHCGIALSCIKPAKPRCSTRRQSELARGILRRHCDRLRHSRESFTQLFDRVYLENQFPYTRATGLSF